MALVYDVGMNNGDDTAYYLNSGYSVVAIEASSDLCQKATERFRNEIASGSLTILNTAISVASGEIDFWTCLDSSEFSSSYHDLAKRARMRAVRAKVKTSRFNEILSSFEHPLYIKIDIEGSDLLCLRDLNQENSPKLISAECECGGDVVPLHEDEYLAVLRAMRSIGYRKFKLVNQKTLTPVTLSTLPSVVEPDYQKELRQSIERDCKWTFPPGSSGPFGDDVPGPWMDFEEAVATYSLCRKLFFRADKRRLQYQFWFDWHAAKG